ncbi:MAG: hypothetical protein B6U85_05455 [Desulfurococcales archaeon ex4484_42]|nr:MAG: hypothetical protein B6U85_05455 [Desulfurococcales archaeon ex4484_42]
MPVHGVFRYFGSHARVHPIFLNPRPAYGSRALLFPPEPSANLGLASSLSNGSSAHRHSAFSMGEKVIKVMNHLEVLKILKINSSQNTQTYKQANSL